jgi:hypothetical protein
MIRRYERIWIGKQAAEGVYPLAVVEERLRRKSQRHAQARFGGGHRSFVYRPAFMPTLRMPLRSDSRASGTKAP